MSRVVLQLVAALPVASTGHANITWGARGLPPGLTIATTNSSTGTAVIRGTPTTNGIWHSVVFPIVNGVPGDMSPIEFNILPAGVNLPTYYPYTRVPAGIKEGSFAAFSGGNYIFGTAGNRHLAFTTNGTDFTLRALPAGVTSAGELLSAATIGANTLALFRTYNRSTGTFVIKAFSSTNMAPFQAASLPPEATNFQEGLAMVADSASFFLVGARGGGIFYGPAGAPIIEPANLKIWGRSASSSQWSARFDASINVPQPGPSIQSASAALSFNRTNPGTIRMMALRGDVTGTGSLLRAVLRSENAGNSWQIITNAPSITSVAYDGRNARFIGSAEDGVWTSGDGSTDWRRLSTLNVGEVTYSPDRKLLFSSFRGVSSNAISWLPYADYAYDAYLYDPDNIGNPPSGQPWLVLNSSGSIVFLHLNSRQSRQLSATRVPSAGALNQQGQVGKSFSYRVEVD